MKLTTHAILKLIKSGTELPLAMAHYPSRGQSAVQKLYQTSKGKFFLKQVSERNHSECQINTASGTLAEREYWAFQLATVLKLHVPTLWLIDPVTTVQVWLDYTDAHIYSTKRGAMKFRGDNVFDCALFDWLTGQEDRHDANYLYNFSEQEVILVDSANSFIKEEGYIPDYLKIYEISEPNELKKYRQTKTKTVLQELSEQKIKKWVPVRGKEEQAGLLRRLYQLREVNTIQGIIELYRGKYESE